MVKYDKSLRRNYSRQPTEIKNEMKIDYDPNKCLEHVNNYKKPKAPNFDLMISRPCDETDPLPAYMKKIYSRQASGMISEKTLKMNNYSDGKFLETYTSFWPKKSFNKLINLNLLNSEKFLDNVGVQATPKSDNAMTEYVQKSMRFYSNLFYNLI